MLHKSAINRYTSWYHQIPKTQLTFGLYKNAEEVTFSDWFKMRFAGWVISSIFDKNLEGIKREVEKT